VANPIKKKMVVVIGSAQGLDVLLPSWIFIA